MNQATYRMIEKETINNQQAEPWYPVEPAWWIILSQELADLWIGGKALYLIAVLSILLGIETFVLATSLELSMYTVEQIVFETLKLALQISLLIGLIIGADSISGERERATLEGLLLTPASRRQIVFGKFMGALSTWPVVLAVTLPFLFLFSQNSDVLGPAVIWGLVVGVLLVPAFTALGMLVSLWCNSNKTSFFVSLGIFLVLILMGQILGTTQIGPWGELLLWVNPLPAGFNFLSELLVENASFGQSWTSLESPMVFAVLAIGLLFLYASPRLKTQAGGVS